MRVTKRYTWYYLLVFQIQRPAKCRSTREFHQVSVSLRYIIGQRKRRNRKAEDSCHRLTFASLITFKWQVYKARYWILAIIMWKNGSHLPKLVFLFDRVLFPTNSHVPSAAPTIVSYVSTLLKINYSHCIALFGNIACNKRELIRLCK